MTDPTATIIAASIQAIGTIAAALIAVLAARKIANDVRPAFHSYSDPSHDLCDITYKAKSDVFIIVAIGDNLLEKYQSEIERLLKYGIHIRYLLLDIEHFQKLESYMHGHPAKPDEYSQVLAILRELQATYPDNMEVRLFHDLLPASYIGIDVWPAFPTFISSPGAVIQTMLYQYRIRAKKLPITYFSPKTGKRHYKATVESMKKMWVDATPLTKS